MQPYTFSIYLNFKLKQVFTCHKNSIMFSVVPAVELSFSLNLSEQDITKFYGKIPNLHGNEHY